MDGDFKIKSELLNKENDLYSLSALFQWFVDTIVFWLEWPVSTEDWHQLLILL